MKKGGFAVGLISFALMSGLLLAGCASISSVNSYKSGNAALDNGDFDRAIMEYSKAIQLDPNNALAYTRRGEAYYYKGDYDKAITDYDQAIRIDANYAVAYNNRGHVYRNQGNYDRAIADLDQAIRLNPNYTKAFANRGYAYWYKGDYDKAITDYDQAIRIDPNYAVAYNNRGLVYRNQGDYDRAIVDYDQTIRLDPNSAVPYTNRGDAYYDKGDYDKAIADYDQAIRIDPDYADARRGLAQAQQQQGGQTPSQVAAVPQPARPQAQAQQTALAKYALVIGNGNYTSISRLRNSVNDANDMADALQSLGFIVDKVLDGDLNQMEAAVSRFRNRLSVSNNAYGFFFYAGHGVQASGINYLLPVNVNIPSENYLGERAVSVQALMGELDDAGNDLNVIVLDACRDNPFGWARSGSRGLAVLSAPVGSILVYATSANSVASDGTGRNGLFTGQLLRNLRTPGLNVQELFTKTGQDVLTASGGTQHPEISLRFFGTAYLGTRP